MRFLRKIYNDSLLKNSFFLMASYLLNLIFGFFFWVIAARYYTPSEVGTTSALLSSMLLISMISTLGFQTAFVFYLPRNKKNVSRIINSGLTSSMAASIIFSVIFILGLDIWAPALKSILYDSKFFMPFVIFTALTTISGLISSAFIAGKRSSFFMTKEMLFAFIKILPLQVFSTLGALGIFIAWGIGVLVAVAIGFFWLSLVWKGYSPTLMLDPIIKSMAVYSIGNYLAEIFYSLPRLMLPIMIVNIVSPESTGFFYIAMMIATLLYGIPQSISNSLLAESSDTGELLLKVKKSIKLNAVLLLPGILFFMLLGKFVLNLFDPLYAENASGTLILLAIASLPLSFNTMFMTIRNAQKKVFSVVKINAAIAAITLAFALPLVRSSGIEGAAFAYLGANTIIAIVVIYKMKDLKAFVLDSAISKVK